MRARSADPAAAVSHRIQIDGSVSSRSISASSIDGLSFNWARVSRTRIFLDDESTSETRAGDIRTDLPPIQLLVSTTR